MSKHYFRAIVATVALSCAFAACSVRTPEPGDLQTDSTYVNVTEHLFGDTAMPACNLIISHTWISSADEPTLRDSLNHILQRYTFGDDYALKPVDTAIKDYTENYTASFRNDYEPLYTKEQIAYAQTHDHELPDGSYAPMAWYSFYENIATRMPYYHKHLLTFSIYREEYTGGAHGTYGTTFVNIDLRTLKIITLDDLLKGDDYDEQLADLIIEQLMADNKASTRDELFDMGYGTTGSIVPTENFRLGPEGITFYYNIYEIAPYVIGPVSVTVSLDKLADLLRDDYMIVAELKGE